MSVFRFIGLVRVTLYTSVLKNNFGRGIRSRLSPFVVRNQKSALR